VILAIDPGNEQSAYAVLDEKTLKPMKYEKIDNYELAEIIRGYNESSIVDTYKLAIEMVASYGMPVGAEVFETCVWIGRFLECANCFGERQKIYRKDEKMNLCHTMKAKDGNIRQALIDRFGPVGTKKNPGWFYGFSGDVWQAYAVGVTYADMQKDNREV
jgi:hypothetical protein